MHSNQLQLSPIQSLLINKASHSHQISKSSQNTLSHINHFAILEATQSNNICAARAEVKKIEDHQLEMVMEGINKILEFVERKKRTNYVIVASVGARHCILESQRDTIAAYAKGLDDIKKVERPHHQMIMCTTKWDTTIAVKFSGESLEVIPEDPDDFEDDFELSQMMAQAALNATPQRSCVLRRGR